MKSRGSNTRSSDDISKGNLINPSHHPMPGVDDEPIDAGTQLPSRATEKESGNLQKKVDKGGQPKGFDPDDVLT